MIEYYGIDGQFHSVSSDFSSYLICGATSAAMRLGLGRKAQQEYIWRFIGFKPW